MWNLKVFLFGKELTTLSIAKTQSPKGPYHPFPRPSSYDMYFVGISPLSGILYLYSGRFLFMMLYSESYKYFGGKIGHLISETAAI